MSFISSFFHGIGAALQSVFAFFQSILQAILGTVQAIFSTVWGAISGIALTFEGLIKFILGNIVVIGGAAAAFIVYTAYQQRTRTSPAVEPARQKKIN